MNLFMTPRTLVYKDIESFNYFLGDKTELTLEREFYDRLIKRPFIEKSNNPPRWILEVFNNARYIYYLVQCEVNSRSLCFNEYIAIAAKSTDDKELNCHITAATMALVHNWLKHDLSEDVKTRTELSKYENIHFDKSIEIDDDIQSLCEKIYLHFSEEMEEVTAECIRDFHSLLLKDNDLPTNIETLFNDLREIEEAALNAPIIDVARGIDYLMECYDPEHDTNGGNLFLKIIIRFEDERYSASDSEIIESAKEAIKRWLRQLESAKEPKPFSLGLSLEDITVVSDEEPEIDPKISGHIAWILDLNKAPNILKLLQQFMVGKTKPKDVLMALCAALETGVIRKPTIKEYNVVFKEYPIKSDDSFNRWVDSGGASTYKQSSKTKKAYDHLLKKFAEIKE